MTTPPQKNLPWSHRQSYGLRLVISVTSAGFCGAVGTLAHRMGAAQNIPYGLVLALLIIGLSAWCARSRSGGIGLACHLTVSSITVWALSNYGPGGGLLIAGQFAGAGLPFFTQYSGYIWLLGVTVVQVLLLCFPHGWFAIESRAHVADDRVIDGHETMKSGR